MGVVAKVLGDAKSLVESGWTKDTLARNESGYPVAPGSPEATCWCLVGALVKASGPDGALCRRVIDFAGTFISRSWTLDRFNDQSPGPEPVINLLRRAHERAAHVDA